MESGKIQIQSRRYYREFDNTDNPCCWQVDLIGNDIEEILSQFAPDLNTMYEDWGASFDWTNVSGVVHCMNIACVDVDNATFEIDYWAFRKRWLFFTSEVADNDSDFRSVVPLLRKLNDSP